MASITAILTAYRRPQNLQPLVAAIRTQSVPAEQVWAFANEPSPDMEALLKAARLDRVVTSSTNTFFHGRFALALLATTEYVALFDDDSVPGEEWFANCLETIERTPGILGTAGIRLHSDGYGERTMHGWQTPGDETIEVDLVGQAWFLRTEWVKYLFASPAHTGTNGEDIELSARALRLAGIRSYCPPHPAGDKRRWGSTLGLELGLDAAAASLKSGHLEERDRIVRAEMAAGWVPLFRRQHDSRVFSYDSLGQRVLTPDTEFWKPRPKPPSSICVEGPNYSYSYSSAIEPGPVDHFEYSIQEDGPCVSVVGPYQADDAPNDADYSPGLTLDPSLMRAVSSTAARVLYLCGRGAPVLARHLVRAEGKVVRVTDWDFSKALASIGGGQPTDVAPLQGLPEPGTSLNAVVLDQVLSQVASPESLLRWARNSLAQDGVLVAEISNVRHRDSVEALFTGQFDWNAHGPDGEPHLRFFTRREIEKLFFRAGFEIESLEPVATPELAEWNAAGRPNLIQAGPLVADGLPEGEAEEFYVKSYRIQARITQQPDYGLTSIVIVTLNQWDYTRQCLETIRFRTDEPYELIVVDNGSTDGTVERLRAMSGVRLIENGCNRGFPAAANRGIEAAIGRQVLLLNNDVIVTTGWLERLLAALHCDPRIGLVGPSSNYVGGIQQIPTTYTDLASLDGFAWDQRKSQFNVREEVDRLVGFCLLIRGEVIETIQLLDERFGLGNFEDDDYCRRALKAGWRAVIARDSFIHHFGHVSFRGNGVDLHEWLVRNQEVYRKKWAAFSAPDQGNGTAAAEPDLSTAAVSDAHAAEMPIRLSLCMIVRDNAATIRPCLESIRPWVDEIIVVDTGSTDETPAICRELGARVFEFPWCDSFSAARNASLEHARGEWIFWMDSDDTITAECGRRLRELALGLHRSDVLGYVMQVHCPGPEGPHDMTRVDHVKLFRNRQDLRFEGRIHEQIIAAIRRADGEIVKTDIYVDHSGSDQSAEGRRRKALRDLRILERDLCDRPEHPFVLFNLGMTHADLGNYEESIGWLERSLRVSNRGDSHVRKVYALLATSLTQLDRLDAALEACRRGRLWYSKDPELLFREGIVTHRLGRLTEAERAYLGALANDDAEHFSSIDPGIVGFKARHNLAGVYMDMGAHDKAEAQWRLIVAEIPDYADGWWGLGQSLLAQERIAEVEQLAGYLNANAQLQSVGLRLQAKLAKRNGDTISARTQLERAAANAPNDPQPLNDLCQLLFEIGKANEAEQPLLRLIEIEPNDASARQNLGSAYLAQGRFEDAAKILSVAASMRKNSAQTYNLLGTALVSCGQLAEAKRAWISACELEPNGPQGASARDQARRFGVDLSATAPNPVSLAIVPPVTPSAVES